jgi:saccharopine dehydrogenase (NADP+, L-glutamate forming)
MKKILVLGSGLVAKPLIDHLLDQPGLSLTVGSLEFDRAKQLIGNRPSGRAIPLDIADTAATDTEVRKADLVVSLLPYVHHVSAANLCLKHRKHLVTTSYVSDGMRALDAAAKKAGVIFLNETGLDPGIDHMSAMRVIHGVEQAGGKISGFSSYCGGLPAPEANNNPFGYKFSWSPRGVVMAGRNPAKFLKNGKVVGILGEDLFAHFEIVRIEGLGEFEGYPNRDSLGYIETYGIRGTRTMFRGTLRNLGWCDALKKIVELGYVDDSDLGKMKGLTFADLTAKLAGVAKGGNIRSQVAKKLGVPTESEVISRIDWLGLFGDTPLPVEKGAPIDVLAARMLEKMQYAPGERDMVVLRHEFVAEYPAKKVKGKAAKARAEKITSTLIDFGVPNGDSAMSRTVALPAAICARLILSGKLKLRGVQIPVVPEIYGPVLKQLEQVGIRFEENVEPA